MLYIDLVGSNLGLDQINSSFAADFQSKKKKTSLKKENNQVTQILHTTKTQKMR
jgi:hypothetical protein